MIKAQSKFKIIHDFYKEYIEYEKFGNKINQIKSAHKNKIISEKEEYSSSPISVPMLLVFIVNSVLLCV